MKLKDYFEKLYDYMYWANHRYFAVAEGLNDEQLHRMQGHSWGNIHAMLVHMMSAEAVWLQRWKGTSPKAYLNEDDYPMLADIKMRWSQQEADMRAFLSLQTEESLETEIAYNNFRNEAFRVPLWQMVLHAANHATHHRGELAAMFALMNVPHPEEEVIQYFLNASGQKKF